MGAVSIACMVEWTDVAARALWATRSPSGIESLAGGLPEKLGREKEVIWLHLNNN
jgi:hypothetical protein